MSVDRLQGHVQCGFFRARRARFTACAGRASLQAEILILHHRLSGEVKAPKNEKSASRPSGASVAPSRSGFNTDLVITAPRRRCLQPSYFSVVCTDMWPSRSWICSSSPVLQPNGNEGHGPVESPEALSVAKSRTGARCTDCRYGRTDLEGLSDADPQIYLRPLPHSDDR